MSSRILHESPAKIAGLSVHDRRALSPEKQSAAGRTETSKIIEKNQLHNFCLSLANRELPANNTPVPYHTIQERAAQLEDRRSDWDIQTYDEWQQWRAVRVEDEQEWRRSVLRGQNLGIESLYWPEDKTLTWEAQNKYLELPPVQSSSSFALEQNKLLCGVIDFADSDDEPGGSPRTRANNLLHEQMHRNLASAPQAQLKLMQYLAGTETRYKWDEKRRMRRAFPPQQYVLTVVAASGLEKADIFDGSDPYVRVWWNGRLVGETDVATDTLEPQWNHAVPLLVHAGQKNALKVLTLR